MTGVTLILCDASSQTTIRYNWNLCDVCSLLWVGFLKIDIEYTAPVSCFIHLGVFVGARSV